MSTHLYMANLVMMLDKDYKKIASEKRRVRSNDIARRLELKNSGDSVRNQNISIRNHNENFHNQNINNERVIYQKMNQHDWINALKSSESSNRTQSFNNLIINNYNGNNQSISSFRLEAPILQRRDIEVNEIQIDNTVIKWNSELFNLVYREYNRLYNQNTFNFNKGKINLEKRISDVNKMIDNNPLIRRGNEVQSWSELFSGNWVYSILTIASILTLVGGGFWWLQNKGKIDILRQNKIEAENTVSLLKTELKKITDENIRLNKELIDTKGPLKLIQKNNEEIINEQKKIIENATLRYISFNNTMMLLGGVMGLMLLIKKKW